MTGVAWPPPAMKNATSVLRGFSNLHVFSEESLTAFIFLCHKSLSFFVTRLSCFRIFARRAALKAPTLCLASSQSKPRPATCDSSNEDDAERVGYLQVWQIQQEHDDEISRQSSYPFYAQLGAPIPCTG